MIKILFYNIDKYVHFVGSFVHGSTALGNVIAMGLSGLIAASNLGWPGIFYIFSCLAVIMSLIFFFRVKDCPSLHSTISLEEKTYIIKSLCNAQRGAKSVRNTYVCVCMCVRARVYLCVCIWILLSRKPKQSF